MAKYASGRTKDPQVAQFVKMLGEEHRKGLKSLVKLAPDAAREGVLSDSKSIAAKKEPIADTPSTSVKTAAPPPADMNAIQHEIAQQCINDSQAMLAGKSDVEFDRCFVGMEMARHMAMHTKLQVFQRHCSGELQQVVTDSLSTTVKHLKAAESLMKQLDDNHISDRVANRDSENTRTDRK